MQYLFLDESGSLKSDNNSYYFAIGGIFVNDYENVKKGFVALNKELKKKYGLGVFDELKGAHITKEEEKDIFCKIQKLDNLYLVAVVCEKSLLPKNFGCYNEPIYYNYLVGKLIHFLIRKEVISYDKAEKLEINIDNRAMPVPDKNALENYLNILFNIHNDCDLKIKVEFIDSASNYMIQLSDIIVNTIWRYTFSKDAPLEYVRLSKDKLRVLRYVKPKWYRR